MHQLDVKNAFLHGTLCRLNKSLYGLKHALRAWFSRFASYRMSIGFVEWKADISLFIYYHGTCTTFLLLYVDDIVLTASSDQLLHHIIQALQHEFSMTDMGQLHHFLGVSVARHRHGLHLSQRQYTLDILERAGLSDCKPCNTPVDTCSKLSAAGDPFPDPTHYWSIAGALQYLTFTHPDISFAVQQVCLYMHDPRLPHLAVVKRILRYLCGTLDYGLLLSRTSTAELVVYSDADWAGCSKTRRSTSGYGVFLGNNLISWSSKRQHTVSRVSAEAEYRAVAKSCRGLPVETTAYGTSQSFGASDPYLL